MWYVVYGAQHGNSRVDIARVVVHTDGHEGPVLQELDPVTHQLCRDEVAEPGGQLLALPHHRGDVGQACRGERGNCESHVSNGPVIRVMQNTGGEHLSRRLRKAVCTILQHGDPDWSIDLVCCPPLLQLSSSVN